MMRTASIRLDVNTEQAEALAALLTQTPAIALSPWYASIECGTG